MVHGTFGPTTEGREPNAVNGDANLRIGFAINGSGEEVRLRELIFQSSKKQCWLSAFGQSHLEVAIPDCG